MFVVIFENQMYGNQWFCGHVEEKCNKAPGQFYVCGHPSHSLDFVFHKMVSVK